MWHTAEKLKIYVLDVSKITILKLQLHIPWAKELINKALVFVQ